MKQYFANHPVIEYRGLSLRNLMLSARVVKAALTNASVMYPYTLEEGDTPTMIAYDYYGSVDYVWLVLLSNNMIDPYTQWYKSQADFDAYIIKKYGSIEAAMNTIDHFSNRSDISAAKVSATTFQYMSADERTLLDPVSAYDTEVSLNESRRVINLIDASNAPRISLELERLLQND